jgi:hypothetical protein
VIHTFTYVYLRLFALAVKRVLAGSCVTVDRVQYI